MKLTTFAFIGFTLFSSLCSADELDYAQSDMIDDSLAPLYKSGCQRKLSKFIEEASQEKYASVTRVSLSKNSILDPGVENLRDQLWLPGRLPALKELDISFNRITPKGLSLFEPLLDRVDFESLNIVGNSATSIEAEPYFRQLSPRHLGKLIWISEKHLDARKWTVLLTGREDQESIVPCVEAIHRQYYAAKKREILEGLDIPLDVAACNPERDLLSSISEFDKSILVRTYERACAGDAEAINVIGVSYWRGTGIKKDLRKALMWLNDAVLRDNVDAFFNRGMIRKDIGETEAGLHDIEVAAKRWHQSAREMLRWDEEKTESQGDSPQASE